MLKGTPLCAIIHTNTHTHTHTHTHSHHANSCVEQIAITGLLCRGNLKMHSSFALSALAFVLLVEKSHTKPFRHQRRGTTEIANCKILTVVSEGCRRAAAPKNHTNKQHSVISASLEHSFSPHLAFCVFHTWLVKCATGPGGVCRGVNSNEAAHTHTHKHAHTHKIKHLQTDLCIFTLFSLLIL